MHELLQKMGQDIVHPDCPQEPRKHSKLWLYKDIHHVLITNTVIDHLLNLSIYLIILFNKVRV